MGSRSTQPAAAATMMTLASVMTLEGHKSFLGSKRSMAYSPDGKRIISVCSDQTIRQWDLQAGREIEQVRHLYEGKPYRAEISRGGRWVMTFGRDGGYAKVKAYEVETGIVKTATFQDSGLININSFDISADGKVLACVSLFIVLIWGMDTGKLVAQLGPFRTRLEGLQHSLTYDDIYQTGGVRFSPDSKKLAVESNAKRCLEVWDVQTQKVDAQVGKKGSNYSINAPIFWTKKGTILAAFNFDFNDYVNNLDATTIYEFNASTLETVGDPFEREGGIGDLALSFDETLLASYSSGTIKLWSLEPRQLLASFLVQHHPWPYLNLTFSPDTRQLASRAYDKIFMYNIPPDILASIRVAPDAQAIVGAPDNSTPNVLLNSDATRRRANVHRNPATSPMISLPPRPLQPMHPRELQQPVFFRHLRNLLSFSSHLNARPPVRNGQPRDPLDIPATSSRLDDDTAVAHTTQGHSHSDPYEHSRHTMALPTTLESATAPATLATKIRYLWRWWPVHSTHHALPIVDVPLAQGLLRNAAAGAHNNDEDLIPEEYFDTSSQNPGSKQPSAATQIDIGDHEHGRSCFCF